MDIKIDYAAALADLDRLSNRVAPAVEKALDRTAQVALNAKVRAVRRTYARPIPRGKNGKPRWERSGDLLQGQVIESKPMERIIGTTGNAAKPIKNYPGGYAERLANLPTGRDGINRSNPFDEDAQRIVEPQVQVVFEQALRNELNI